MFLPLTLIASILGMNVHVPGEGDMTASTSCSPSWSSSSAAMIAYFRKRGFL